MEGLTHLYFTDTLADCDGMFTHTLVITDNATAVDIVNVLLCH